MTETEFEKILLQALKESASENSNKLLEGYDKNNVHVFSDKFKRQMYKDMKNAGINPRGIIELHRMTKYNKFAASAAAVFIILTGMSFAIPDVRAVVWGAVIEWFENQINIYFSDTGNDKIESAIYPAYIPEGYEKSFEDIGENNADIFYSEKNGDGYINFSFYVSSVSISADNDISEYKAVDIGKYSGYILKSDGINTIIWQDEKYVYEINAQKSDVDLVQIAESIYKNQNNEVK